MGCSVTERVLLEELQVILGRDDIRVDAPLHEMGVDSMAFVELLVFIEKRFKVRLMDSGLKREDFYSIRSLAGRIDAGSGDA
ncbi:MAG: acyl carrier protein [Candidatus Omnitrophica bacterium]|nr:acyl carrier protein [Candidatus Omnitrophota bacterium]